MALPDYFEITYGTSIIWGEAGASGVTATLSLNGLLNGAARMGEAVDLGANRAESYDVYLLAETGTAPTAGTTLDLYLACSYNNSTWPAKVTGGDASYDTGTSDANLRQLGRPVMSLVATADGTTVLVAPPVIWYPAGRYVSPVIDNNLGQALRAEVTATDNGSRVILVPRRNAAND